MPLARCFSLNFSGTASTIVTESQPRIILPTQSPSVRPTRAHGCNGLWCGETPLMVFQPQLVMLRMAVRRSVVR